MRQTCVTCVRYASDIAPNARNAHNAHSEKQQVRSPLRRAQGSRRTPHDASSERCQRERVAEKPRSKLLSRLVAWSAPFESVKRASQSPLLTLSAGQSAPRGRTSSIRHCWAPRHRLTAKRRHQLRGHEPTPRRTRQQGPPRARRNRVASVRSRPIVVGPVLRSWTNWPLLASKPFRIAYHFSRRTPGHYRGDKTGSSLFIDPQWSPRGRKIRSCSVGPCHPLPAVGADTNWPTRKQSVKALPWAGFG